MEQTTPLAPTAAASYESFMVRWRFQPWAGILLAMAALRPGEQVLDLAAGTGVVARGAAPLVGPAGTVVATDINPASLAVGSALAPEPGAAPIAWEQVDATQLPYAAGSFDAVLCQQGLQFFPDPAVAMAEVRRVLAPGGRAVFAVWHDLAVPPAFAVLNEVAARQLGFGPFVTSFRLGDATRVAALLTQARLSDVTVTPKRHSMLFPAHQDFVRGLISGVTPIVPELATLDAASWTALVTTLSTDFVEALRGYAWGDGLDLAMTANIAVDRAGPGRAGPGRIGPDRAGSGRIIRRAALGRRPLLRRHHVGNAGRPPPLARASGPDRRK